MLAEHRIGASGTEAALRVTDIRLADFRNYRAATVCPAGSGVVLWGPNGAGKTNLLEAVSLLAPGRGLRGARLAEIDRRDGGPFRLAARLATAEGPREVETWHEASCDRRLVRLEGGPPRAPVELGSLAGIVWLTPAMDRLLAEAPSGRRRFLDRLVLAHHPEHARAVAGFERAMRERARLLREPRVDPLWLDAIERRMAERGVAVAAARRRFVRELAAELAVARDGFPALGLELSGEVEARLGEASALDVEEWFVAGLAAARARDAELGGAAVGPHRSDLLVLTAGGEPVASASTGQQKLALLAILLAAVRLRQRVSGEAPVVLLDEVAAHLDPGRRLALFEALHDTGAQVWLTGTDRDLFRPLVGRARIYRVFEAKLDEDD